MNDVNWHKEARESKIECIRNWDSNVKRRRDRVVQKREGIGQLPPTPKILPTKGQRNGCSVSPVDEMKLVREAVNQVSLTKKREREMRPALPWGEEKVRAHETNARTALARRVLPLVHLRFCKVPTASTPCNRGQPFWGIVHVHSTSAVSPNAGRLRDRPGVKMSTAAPFTMDIISKPFFVG